MEGDHIKINHWLIPLSGIYGLVVGIRNILFDCGLLHSKSFDVPVIDVGNISAGGTGKTPHTEYLIRLLSKKHQVAVLSRGYKRKSSGYLLATKDTPMQLIGDEPFQMKKKFPHIHMAVDSNRRRGISKLCQTDVTPKTDVIVMDDAYQHRYITPSINILLMDYHRLVYFDKLLPAGRLREPRSSSQRADIVIVTKCPDYITPMEQHGIARSLQMQPWQKLFFTRFNYQNLVHITSGRQMPLDSLKEKDCNILLLTAIASPQQMEYDLKKYCQFTSLHFADHHNFSKKDLANIQHAFDTLCANQKETIIITTEKDAARLQACAQEMPFYPYIYILPVEVHFLDDGQIEFNQTILKRV